MKHKLAPEHNKNIIIDNEQYFLRRSDVCIYCNNNVKTICVLNDYDNMMTVSEFYHNINKYVPCISDEEYSIKVLLE